MLEILLVLLLVLPAAVGQTYFVYRYARYSSAWRDSRVGRALMVMAATLAILVDTQVVNELSYYTESKTLILVTTIIEVIAYVLVSVAIWWQVATLVKTQDKEKDDNGGMGKGRG